MTHGKQLNRICASIRVMVYYYICLEKIDLMLFKFIIAENITFPIIIYYYCCDNPACSKTFKKMNANGEV